MDKIKKILSNAKLTPELFANLVDELRLFFQVNRVKVESKDPKLREAAYKEVADLRALFEQHPVIKLNQFVTI